jgi:hypothetical protein
MSANQFARRSSWQRPVALVLLIVAALLALSLAILTHQAS